MSPGLETALAVVLLIANPFRVDREWDPRFVGYFYLSFTNATASSPTDTMPLTRWSKIAMVFESLVALVTVGLVVARAVNVSG